MTSDEVKARMWEAYKAGMIRVLEQIALHDTVPEIERESFDAWLAEECPEVANAEEPYFNAEDEALDAAIEKDVWEERFPRDTQSLSFKSQPCYWHEFGCQASVHTPAGVGLCSCEGKHPDGTYDHDYLCECDKKHPIGWLKCTCIQRRRPELATIINNSNAEH